ncbi:MAG: hypothetical protein NVS2B7_16930 [Herpetosiphon sp.]
MLLTASANWLERAYRLLGVFVADVMVASTVVGYLMKYKQPAELGHHQGEWFEPCPSG